MGRKFRDQTPGELHHVGTRGNDRHAVVFDELDRTEFLRTLATTVARYRWRCLAYTVLGNHYHLIVEPQDENLALGMAYLNGRHAARFNRRHGRGDHVFGTRYWSERVRDQAHLEELSLYLPANAPRARLCDRAEDWAWCSYGATLGLAPAASFLDPVALLELYGSDPQVARERYRRAVDEYVRERLEET